jgi:hypothetical protein
MRLSALTLIGALGLAVSSVTASAAPIAPALDIQRGANIVQVAGGCGWGLHPNRWGRCVSNRYGYCPPPSVLSRRVLSRWMEIARRQYSQSIERA